MRCALHYRFIEIHFAPPLILAGNAPARIATHQRPLKSRYTVSIRRARFVIGKDLKAVIPNQNLPDFNLDFYTEVQDLSHLESKLNASLPKKFASLNMAFISLIEDYSILGFETLAVEVCFTHSSP